MFTKRWQPVTRRQFLKLAGGTSLALALNACGFSRTGRTLRVGYIGPQTGPLAGFGEADAFILGKIREVFNEGIMVGNTRHPIEIVTADTESNPEKAAEVALDMIINGEMDLITAAFTPETTNPVSDQCELNQFPCITAATPWQAWYFRTDVPMSGYSWTYHFCWGLEDVIQAYLALWDSLETNKVAGGLWPNDGDGFAWSDPDVGFPPSMIARGYKVIDPGRYENLSEDFTPQITRFKEEGVEIVTGVMLPPDLATFLEQAQDQDFHPKMVTVGKAALFPAAIGAIPNDLGDGLTSEYWWGPNYPFTSSLTGVTPSELIEAYEVETNNQWTQPIGFLYSLFEVVADVLSRTEDVDDKNSIMAAMKATDVQTVIGQISWQNGPTPNVAKTPMVGGQWGKGETFPWQISVISNDTFPEIAVDGAIRPYQ